MSKPSLGLVAIASEFESGGQRSEEILKGAIKYLKDNGLEVVAFEKTVWDPSDAFKAVDYFSKKHIDLLVMIHITWVLDSLQYIFINNIKCPVILWGVPYAETFSIGSVHHFGSILKEQGFNYKYVYGLPENSSLINEITRYATTARIYKKLNSMRIALVGPRQTWKVAGSQDMTSEEWEFSKKFGVTIIHVEMDEVLELAAKQEASVVEQTLLNFKKQNRIGKIVAGEENIKYAVKVYLAMKEIIKHYTLDAVSAECYPKFSGLVNLPSSWLADEGIVIDTEGDIAHTFLMTVINQLKPGPTALAEIGSIKDNIIYLVHEGSSAHSIAEDISKVQISASGELGTFVGTPFKAMPEVTMLDLSGRENTYKMLIAKVSTEQVSYQEWVDGGSKFFAKVNLGSDAISKFNKMLSEGIDHHLLLKEGDLVELLTDLCTLLKIKRVEI
jgi:L-fucose isomerase-like protein